MGWGKGALTFSLQVGLQLTAHVGAEMWRLGLSGRQSPEWPDGGTEELAGAGGGREGQVGRG